MWPHVILLRAWAPGSVIRYQVPLWHWTISMRPIFHLLGKTYCLIPLSAHHLTLLSSLSHVTKWSSFAPPWSYSTGRWIFNVRKVDVSRWAVKYSTKTKIKHISMAGCFTVWYTVCICHQETLIWSSPWQWNKIIFTYNRRFRRDWNLLLLQLLKVLNQII